VVLKDPEHSDRLAVVMIAVCRVAHLGRDHSQSHRDFGQADSGQWEQASVIFCDLYPLHGGGLFVSATKLSRLLYTNRTWRTAAVAVWIGAPVVIPIAIQSAWRT
jgi:hypothetical protein